MSGNGVVESYVHTEGKVAVIIAIESSAEESSSMIA